MLWPPVLVGCLQQLKILRYPWAISAADSLCVSFIDWTGYLFNILSSKSQVFSNPVLLQPGIQLWVAFVNAQNIYFWNQRHPKFLLPLSNSIGPPFALHFVILLLPMFGDHFNAPVSIGVQCLIWRDPMVPSAPPCTYQLPPGAVPSVWLQSTIAVHWSALSGYTRDFPPPCAPLPPLILYVCLYIDHRSL